MKKKFSPFKIEDDEDAMPPPPEINWQDDLKQLLAPYQPAQASNASNYFTTAEIVQALEEHYGVPQGIVGKEIVTLIPGSEVVEQMRALGYTAANTGGLHFQWLLKKKDKPL